MDIQFLNLLSLQGLMLAGVVALAGGIWAMSRERRSPHDRPVAALLVSVAVWVFAYVLWQASSFGPHTGFWLQALYLAGPAIPAAFLLFSIAAFLGRRPSGLAYGVLCFPVALAYPLIYHTDVVIVRSAVPDATAFGFGLFALAFVFFAYALAALALLFAAAWTRRLARPDRLFLLIAGGIAAMSPVGLLLFYFVPIAGPALPIALPFTVLAGVFLVAFAAIRQEGRTDPGMFGIEILVFMVLFVLTTDTVASATDRLEFSLRFAILVLLVVVGAMMIRVHTREVARLRSIEAMHGVLAKMNAKLIEADRVKTKFVAFASHQLRAPIGGIRGYLDMLRKGDFGELSAQQTDIIDKNLDALTRLTVMIKSFVDVTKIEFGRFDAYKTDEYIVDVISRVMSEMTPTAFKQGLRIDAAVQGGLPRVNIDAGKIHNALVNLVDNAIKYTKEGGITVRAERQGKELAVIVEDTGAGLTKKDMERIDNLLESGISAVKLESSGEGLGLYIVKNIVEAHGGRMIISSDGRGKGSRIGFALPLEE